MKSPSRATFFYSAYWISALMVCLLIGLTGQVAFGQAAATPPASKVRQMPGSNPNLPKYKPNEVLVRFRKGVGQAAIAAVHGKVGGQVIRAYRSVEGLQHVRIPSNMKVEEAIRRYRQNPEVLYAEPNFRRQALAIPNDPMFPDLWGLDNTGQSGGVPDADIDAPEAWNLSTGSSSVIVADIDTGIDYNHEDLVANVFNNPNDCDADNVDDDGNGWVDDCHGIDTINLDSDPWDDVGHGTHTAGTIGATGNNGLGVVGVNWSVTIMACKFLGPEGGSDDGAIACLDYIAWMKDHGYNIVATNNSWGGGGSNQALLDAILAQGQRGILFFAAAGNEANDNDVWPTYPANYYAPNLLSIAATDRYDSITSFSHWGRRTVHLGAPGEEILSTVPAVNILPCPPGDFYCSLPGTSMATPHVTGVAALLKAQDPTRDWRAIKNLILAGGDATSSLADTVTQKRLNAYGAMTCSNSTVFSRLRPIPNSTGTGVGVPLDLSALNINCAAPNGDVPVTVDPGGSTVTLLDDGAGTDLAAADGIYSGQWTPGAPGTYTLTFPDGDVVTVNVAASYLYSPAPYNYRTIAGTNLQFGDDSSAMITPPFPIQFGTGSFNNVFVGSNGVISLSDYFYEYLNQPLPTDWIETLVAPFWDDLVAFGSGADNNVFWEVIGTTPNRELVVEWRNIRHYGCAESETVNFQVVFSEGRSDILFNYADAAFGGGCTWADYGADATVGVQVGSGVATQFSYESPSLSDSFALLWSMGQVALNPSSVDFGELPVGTPSAPHTITLTNNAAASVNLGTIEITPADFTQTNNCVSPIVPGGTCTFTVTFTPTAMGSRNGTLTVNHDATGSPSYAFLTGRGVSNGLPGFDHLSLDFGDLELGTTSPHQTVTLTNNGSGPLGVVNVETTGDFAIHHNDCPTSLPVGGLCTIGVTFTPLRLGLRSGELRIAHDGAGSPAIVNLTGNGTPPPDGTYVYTNNDPWYEPNTVSGFLVAPDGALIEIPGSPFQTAGTGGGGGYFSTNRAAISSVGNFLYVSNAGTGDISGFAIDPLNGNLTPVPGSPFFAGGGSPWYGTSVAATADGQFIIASNADAMAIYVYAKADNGSLVPAPGSPYTPDSPPAGIKISPDGRFLALALPQHGEGTVAMYSIGTDGSLSPVPGSPFPDGGDGDAAGVDIDCGSRYAFVGEATYPGTIVDVFSIGPDGALTPIPGSPFAPPGSGDNSNVPLLSPDDRVLFVSNQYSNSVTVFTVAADGSLTMVSGSPFPVGGAAYFTSGMATDQAGRFLFAANFDNWVGAFSIGEGGVLTPVPDSPFSTGQPFGLLSLAAFPAKGCGLAASPGSIDFGQQRVGVPSTSQTVSLVNRSAAAVNISSTAATGDFSIPANACVGSLEPGVPCNIDATFTPVARGLREGELTITSNAVGSPTRVQLRGTGVAPEIHLSVGSLAFGEQPVGMESGEQLVEMENVGDFVLGITSFTPSGDFGLAETCESSLGIGEHCILSIRFAPTALGARTGGVEIRSDAINDPQSISLSGTGVEPVDITVPSGNPTSITVNAGQAADFTLSLGPLSGFTGAVTLSCTETITEGSCSVTPTSATLDGVTPVNVTVRATTTARSTAAPNNPPLRPLPPLVNLVGLLWLLSLVAFATLAAARRDARRHARLALGTALLLIALWAACGGGGAPAPAPPRGTPAGTYTITVTATVGNFTDSTTLNLTVN